MADHSNEKNEWVATSPDRLNITYHAGYRMVLRMTFPVMNPYLPTNLRPYYGKHRSANGGEKESE